MMDMDPVACYRAMLTRDARFDGRLFIAVRTTGIYCRPICPARPPKFENVFCGWLPRCKGKIDAMALVGCSLLSGLLMQSA